MFKKLRSFAIIFILMGMILVMSACSSGSSFAEGDPYSYSLNNVNNVAEDVDETNEIKFYMVDPFKKKVYVSSKEETEEIEADETGQMYDLEEYEDKEDILTFKYNGVTEKLEKKSDSLWKSLETGLEYDVKKHE